MMGSKHQLIRRIAILVLCIPLMLILSGCPADEEKPVALELTTHNEIVLDAALSPLEYSDHDGNLMSYDIFMAIEAAAIIDDIGLGDITVVSVERMEITDQGRQSYYYDIKFQNGDKKDFDLSISRAGSTSFVDNGQDYLYAPPLYN
jgi:hypothetical protein